MPQTILLSAYACEPNKGSEPGVGWAWVCELAKLGHELHVLTRANNKTAIEGARDSIPNTKNVHFIYYDLPTPFLKAKKIPFGVQMYYGLWQLGIYRVAKRLIKNIDIDYVQHITFVGVRQPSYLIFLNKPFFFGPVAGGESVPFRLRKHYSWSQWFADLVRDFLNLFIKLDPRMWLIFSRSTHVFVTSEQTKNLIPKRFHKKVSIQLAIALSQSELPDSKLKKFNVDKGVKFLFIGRFLEWKGMGLGLRAFSEYSHKFPNATLTMVGTGKAKKLWEQIAIDLEIEEKLTWIDWVSKEQIDDFYMAHDVLLFPSLHDSGGMVVLEAMSHGLPIICLDIGGPGQILGSGEVGNVSVINKSEADLVKDLEVAMAYYSNITVLNDASKRVQKHAKTHTWTKLVKKIGEQNKPSDYSPK
ncbi:MAG: glycosyltransferase family 4 protein [Thiomicrorhabdus sp.]|nr:glycosyltransferase family 4 protein [Thiomicrorhabdus sp.]